jgi:hypothetical protein
MRTRFRMIRFAPAMLAAAAAATPARAQSPQDDTDVFPDAEGESRVSLDFEPESDDANLYYRAGRMTLEKLGRNPDGDPYVRLCEGPCKREIPVGAYVLAVSAGAGKLAELPRFTVVDGPVKIRGRYVDRSATRVTGWVLLSAVIVVGVGMVVAGEAASHWVSPCPFSGGEDGCPWENAGLEGGGALVLLLGVVPSVILSAQGDYAKIEVVPLTAVKAGGSSGREGVAGIATSPAGLGLQLRF